jgi:hypothetical protein
MEGEAAIADGVKRVPASIEGLRRGPARKRLPPPSSVGTGPRGPAVPPGGGAGVRWPPGGSGQRPTPPLPIVASADDNGVKAATSTPADGGDVERLAAVVEAELLGALPKFTPPVMGHDPTRAPLHRRGRASTQPKSRGFSPPPTS